MNSDVKHEASHDLRKNLISIVLDGDELLKLKELIKEVKSGKIEDIILRKAILEFGENAVEKLLKFFPFFASLENQRNNKKKHAQLRKELNEKQKILNEISTKVDALYNKLLEKNKN
jgi:hypothetical protein